MNNIEEIKKDIINDYSEFTELAMMGMRDTMNLRQIAIDNFEQKIENLIKICKNQKNETSTDREQGRNPS